MLTFNRRQLDGFGRPLRDGVIADVLDAIREADLDACADWPDAVLAARVADGCARGFELGLTTHEAVEGYAAFFVAFGPGFVRHPRVATILADVSLTPDERIARLSDRLTDTILIELTILGGPAAWDDYDGEADDGHGT